MDTTRLLWHLLLFWNTAPAHKITRCWLLVDELGYSLSSVFKTQFCWHNRIGAWRYWFVLIPLQRHAVSFSGIFLWLTPHTDSKTETEFLWDAKLLQESVSKLTVMADVDKRVPNARRLRHQAGQQYEQWRDLNEIHIPESFHQAHNSVGHPAYHKRHWKETI